MSRNREFSEWLQQTGRQHLFDARRQALRFSGRSIADSWMEAAREFGIDTFDAPVPPRLPRFAPPAPPPEAPPSDYAADVRWVYENVSSRTVKQEEAPSPGSWELLLWARENKDKFFVQLANKHLATKDDATAQKARREQSGKIREVLDRLAKAGYELPPAISADLPA